jgi:imidazolonepropionase-like amidohydrolase
MRRILTYLTLLIATVTIAMTIAVLLPLQKAPLVGLEGDFAMSGINIVDTITGEISYDMTVLITQGRISDIVHTSEHTSHPGFENIIADGKYLLPGLWDMHTHSLKLSPQLHHPLFILSGVTSVRDMSGCMSEEDSYWACPQDRFRWEQQALNGTGISPRYPLQSSYQTNGGNEVPESFPDFFRLDSASDAQTLVEFYAANQVDFVKTYTELSSDQYDRLVAESARHQIGIAGHKPLRVSLEHALETGMDSIEHGRLFMFECFSGIEAFRQTDNPARNYNPQFMAKMMQDQDQTQCDSLMKTMASSSTSWVPTLTTLKMSAMARKLSFRQDSRLKYIPLIVQKLLWEPDINRASEQGYDQHGNFVHEEFYTAASLQVARAQDAGVDILAGTDNIDTYVFTGSSLHDELSMFVDAGLTPLEAIQSATINPARFAKLDGEFGSVAIGKHADLLLLNTNPLIDIGNTRDIYGVFLGGQFFDENALLKLDRYVADMANSYRTNIRFLYDILSSPLMRVQLAD